MRVEIGEDMNARTSAKYRKEKKVGEGTYANVYQGVEVATGRLVALKKIKVGDFKSGLDMSAIREVKALRELHHPNVIQLIDVFSHKTNLNLVLEFLDTDLEMVIKDTDLIFKPDDIKSWMLMTLRGLYHCHRSWVLHRDLKPNNLLIASDGQLKLADFGLARDYGDATANMTSQVVTRWYRAPELLFGAKKYGYAVDMWAVGCIFAELMLRTPYLPGDSDMDQLNTMFRALGTPTDEDWPNHTQLPDYVQFKQYPRTPLTTLFTATTPDSIDLMEKMLVYNPIKRITALEALNHPYFQNLPRPTAPKKLPKPALNINEGQVAEKRRLDPGKSI
ncbi:kinase-like domain-containing protein [Dimargaris cristalligena]|uniref:[RNA-polymerase]-subunit kinase n=1 Tax=Dimargaris cristalligena TaxID=215637 RepID=A0A4Q0A310_9FUNG|nr:kinase-like domain-containing protein [Dimargaris cristalligena]|eukprot:RKP39931.1 kinase-like domain-containing protein [Dimargaris cristalligena]